MRPHPAPETIRSSAGRAFLIGPANYAAERAAHHPRNRAALEAIRSSEMARFDGCSSL
jgi:hypothetical protein